MATYRVRFVTQTSIQGEQDLYFDYKGSRVVLLLTGKRPPGGTTGVQVDLEAANNREAQLRATAEIVPPVLDALAFTTGTPLLLLYCDLVLKKEPGSKDRKAIFCANSKQPMPMRISEEDMRQTQQILAEGDGPALQLRWHRYALHRRLILDRFLFQWLAFEGLGGTRQIATVCPRCRTEISHCDMAITHAGSDKDAAYKLLARADSEISKTQFNREIWGRMRNAVFHGTSEPSPGLLSKINSLTPKLRKACDMELGRRYALEARARPIRESEQYFYRYTFLQWHTAIPGADFADDVPWEDVENLTGEMAQGEVRANFPEATGITLLDYNKESPNW